MPYTQCPRCRASFHTGSIYEQRDTCPRCGAPLNEPPAPLGRRVRGLLFRRRQITPPDWEAITGAQYGRGRVRPGM